MKKFMSLFLLLVLLLTLVSCGDSKTDEASNAEGSTEAAEEAVELEGPLYTVDVDTLDPTVYPEDYPLIPSDDFEVAFESMQEAATSGKISSYQDFVDLFGVDGAYYKNCDYDQDGRYYKYYGWYADNGGNVLVTFDAKGEDLEFYAWTGGTE